MATKMFALFALLALCASGATAFIPGYFPQAMALGDMNPCMQYCTMQQPFTLGSFTSPALMMLQQPFASPLQQYFTPMMMNSMTMQAQCQCSAISQIMHQQQLPFIFNPMAMASSPFLFQQPFVGVPL
ncbi:unnamed protein product [Urochloa decumbens]|uniref:Storage protein n=1 Tax=Urochloa decumbens TaxID=240449 RepID=A0ABC9CKS0_9POAL